MSIRWYGTPGHFIGCYRCCFRLHTVVHGRIRVITVGCYHPKSAGEPSEDNIESLDASGHIYETMVFDLRESETDPLSVRGYMNDHDAEDGHMRDVGFWLQVSPFRVQSNIDVMREQV